MFGTRLETPKVQIGLAPGGAFNVSFKVPEDIITMVFSAIDVEIAAASDRATQEYILPNRFHLHPGGVPVLSRSDGDTGGILQFVFAPDVRRSMAPDFKRGELPADLNMNVPTPQSAGLARMALRLLLSPYKPDSMTIESIGLMVMAETMRGILENPELGTGFNDPMGLLRLTRVMEVIEAELDQDVSLHRLAEAAEMSAYHFAKSFKAALGLPPRQYVLERRMSRARDLLVATCLSLAEIAYAVGFSSQSHMTATFSARLGVTPLRYRQALAG